MLAANVCASEFLQEREQPALYRVHEGPTPEKLEKLRAFLAEFGFGLGGGDEPGAREYGKVLDQVRDRPDAQLLQTVMLRSLRQAVYSPDNVGHFGLAYEAYTHFTSPIRRYPDLLVHRAIKAALTSEKLPANDWDAIGLHCSQTERRADEATRDVVNWLKCYYMQDKVGETFSGSVSSVVPFGLFVALDDIFIEGLVHISDLGSDYFRFDETRHELAGERTGVRYRLSDRVRVQVVRVDLATTKIDFRLVEADEESGDDGVEVAEPVAARSSRNRQQVNRRDASSTPSATSPARKHRSRKPQAKDSQARADGNQAKPETAAPGRSRGEPSRPTTSDKKPRRSKPAGPAKTAVANKKSAGAKPGRKRTDAAANKGKRRG